MYIFPKRNLLAVQAVPFLTLACVWRSPTDLGAKVTPIFLPPLSCSLKSHSAQAQQQPSLVQGFVMTQMAVLWLPTLAQIAPSSPWGLDKQGWAASKNKAGVPGD